MRQAANEWWETFCRARAQMRELPPPRSPLAEHAARVAEWLRSLLPAWLYGCVLKRGTDTAIMVLNSFGQPRPEWVAPSSGPPRLGQILRTPKMSILITPIACEHADFGELGLGFNPRRKLPAGVAEFVAALGERLALEWALHTRPRLPADIDIPTSARLCANELAGPVIHEFNNFLNTAVLHMALLESEVADELRHDLSSIRGQADVVARMVRQFQKYRDEQRGELASFDLNPAVRDATRFWETAHSGQGKKPHAAERGPRVHLALAEGLPKVQACARDIHCLIQLLLSPLERGANAVVDVTTRAASGHVELSLVLSGQVLDAGRLNELFSGSGMAAHEAEELQLAACKSIVRRLRGKITSQAHPAGAAIVVHLPAISSSQ